MKNKPVIKLQLEMTDKILYSTSILFLLYLIYYSLYAYSVAPDKVPYKFNNSGQATSSGASEIFILFPVLGIFINSLIIYFSRIPHLVNYIVEITNENALTQYKLASRFLIWISIWTTATFYFILDEIFSYSVYGTESKFANVYLILGGFLIIIIIYYILSHSRKNKEIINER